MAGLEHEKFAAALAGLAAEVDTASAVLTEKRASMKVLARAAHAAGMTERDIAKAANRSGPAVHAWLHAEDA